MPTLKTLCITEKLETFYLFQPQRPRFILQTPIATKTLHKVGITGNSKFRISQFPMIKM